MTCPDCAIWRDRYQREHIALKAAQDRLEQLQRANEARDHRPTGHFANRENPLPPKPRPQIRWPL